MLPLDTRYRAVVHYTRFNGSLRTVAKLYGVSKSSLQRWAQHSPQWNRHRKKRKTVVSQDVVRFVHKTLEENPFITASDLAHSITCNVSGVHMSRSTANRLVRRCGFSYKKARRIVDYQHRAESVQSFCDRFNEAKDVVCIDESGFYVGDHRRMGYSRKGSRLNIKSATGVRRVKLTLLLAVSRSEGVIAHQILPHNCRKNDFLDFVKQQLPRASSDQVVLMDNIAFHHSTDVRQELATKGYRVLYSLPYSPKCNTIEMVFGALKQDYRSSCPLGTCDVFCYASHLETVIQAWRGRRLDTFFDHTRDWVRSTLQALERAEGGTLHAFHGFDA